MAGGGRGNGRGRGGVRGWRWWRGARCCSVDTGVKRPTKYPVRRDSNGLCGISHPRQISADGLLSGVRGGATVDGDGAHPLRLSLVDGFQKMVVITVIVMIIS